MCSWRQSYCTLSKKFKSTSSSFSLHILLLCTDSPPHAILKFLTLPSMARALPNVTSRVLVVGLRLGMAEQHIFQSRCLLVSQDHGGRRGDGRLQNFFRFQLREVCSQTSLPASYIVPADVIRTPISIPWMTFERRSAPLPLLMSSWVDALMSSFTWAVVDTADSMALKLDFKLTLGNDVGR